MHVRRRRTAVLLAAAGMVALLTSCASSATPGPTAVATTGAAAADLAAPSPSQIVGTWSVFVLPQSPGASEREVTFAEAQLTTSDGCNTASAGYTLGADGTFAVGEVAQTTSVCAAPGDARHIAALTSATRVGLDDRSGVDQLVFTDSSGVLVLVLQREGLAPG